MTPLTRPRRLRAGDRVAIVAPSGPFPRENLDAGMDILRGWDLDPFVLDHAYDVHPRFGYLAGTDEARARDFEAAWCDPDVAAVFSARGGYGAQRMTDLVDWARLRAAGPKVYLGFSDATALHDAIAVHLGLVSLHGPMPAWATFDKDAVTQEHLRQTLFEPEAVQTVTSPTARSLVPGRARGVTLGGCVSLISAGLGTADARPSAAGGILLIEDIDEEDYRLDRILTQLLRSGWLDGVAGVALGSWKNCGDSYGRIQDVILDRLGPLGVPILEELGFGHGSPALTLPLGVPAELDADARTLRFEVPALA